MQQAGQVPYLDQNDAHEQSLGQSDGSLPGPEQTLNQSISISQNAFSEFIVVSTSCSSSDVHGCLFHISRL